MFFKVSFQSIIKNSIFSNEKIIGARRFNVDDGSSGGRISVKMLRSGFFCEWVFGYWLEV